MQELSSKKLKISSILIIWDWEKETGIPVFLYLKILRQIKLINKNFSK